MKRANSDIAPELHRFLYIGIDVYGEDEPTQYLLSYADLVLGHRVHDFLMSLNDDHVNTFLYVLRGEEERLPARGRLSKPDAIDLLKLLLPLKVCNPEYNGKDFGGLVNGRTFSADSIRMKQFEPIVVVDKK